jgi:hypothetical protein
MSFAAMVFSKSKLARKLENSRKTMLSSVGSGVKEKGDLSKLF